VRMPRMDGFTACRLLAANPATQDIPILILTAVDKLDDRIRGLELGAMDYIVKPFEPAEVIARIRNHLKKIIRTRLDEHLPDLPDGPDAAAARTSAASGPSGRSGRCSSVRTKNACPGHSATTSARLPGNISATRA